MDTELQTIPGLPDYAMTQDGRVWSKPRRKSSKNGKWLKPYICKQGGYSSVTLQKDGKEVCRLIHRLILETYVGPCPDGMECRHLDGNPANNTLSNLKWGTRSENQQDAVRHGTCRARFNSCKGELHWNSKLTRDDVQDIDALYRTRLFTRAKIAKLYRVSVVTISRIINKKSWQWLWEAA